MISRHRVRTEEARKTHAPFSLTYTGDHVPPVLATTWIDIADAGARVLDVAVEREGLRVMSRGVAAV